jgi:superfamily II DNA/RNA helicase
VHRVGRTARANTKGEAITLVNEKDMRKLTQIQRLIEAEITQLTLPIELGAGPEFKMQARTGKRPFKKGNHSRKPRPQGNN